METPETRIDPEFGRMTYIGSSWQLEERQALVGEQSVPITIETEDRATRDISATQRQAVQQALSLPADVLSRSADVVLQNYDVYREAVGDAEMPPLGDDPAQVWDEVTIADIVVPPSPETPTFLLNGECTWDPEHGLTVRFRNGIADAADQQGELS